MAKLSGWPVGYAVKNKAIVSTSLGLVNSYLTHSKSNSAASPCGVNGKVSLKSGRDSLLG